MAKQKIKYKTVMKNTKKWKNNIKADLTALV